MINIRVTREFRPRVRVKEYILSLALCYSVVLYILLILPLTTTVVISCLIITLFATVSLTLLHHALSERCITTSPYGIKLIKGKRFVHVPWPHVLELKEAWVGYGKERHRRFYLATITGEIIELMRDGEYADTDAVIFAIQNYKKETAST